MAKTKSEPRQKVQSKQIVDRHPGVPRLVHKCPICAKFMTLDTPPHRH